MQRPTSFSDIIGHDWLINFLKEHLQTGTLPHFIILDGPEGVGKTSIADLIALTLVYGFDDSTEKRQAVHDVIINNGSNDCIKKFKLSIDGGKDVAKEVLAEMHNTFTLGKKKVIIGDEAHGLIDSAQDTFLADSEFLNKDTYLIMLTTEIYKLKQSFRSRAVPITLQPLKHSDMMHVLQKEVRARNLHIQSEDAVLSLIADWSECKPRTGLKILEAFADNSAVSSNTVRGLIGYLDTADVLPLVESLSGSLTFGLRYINEMTIHSSLIDIISEMVTIKSGAHSYKIKMEDTMKIRKQLENVTTEQLVQFLYGLTAAPVLTRHAVIHAYLGAHNNRKILTSTDHVEIVAQEYAQKSAIIQSVTNQPSAPSLEEVLRNSNIVCD